MTIKPVAAEARVSPGDIEVSREVITPEIATEMLAGNIKNRKVRTEAVDSYALDMAAGRWRLTGDGIRFAPDGTLLDGQHRLLACAKAGVPFETFVFRNVPLEARPAIDTGVKRLAADFLAWAGESEPYVLAAAVRLAIGIERNGGTKMARRIIVSPEEVQQWCDEHPGIREAARIAMRHRAIPAVPAVRAYVFYRLAEINHEAALEFFYALSEREGLFRGDPRHVLAKRLEGARMNRQKLSAVAQVSLFFRTWNAWRKGERIQYLRISSSAGGDVPIPRLL